MPAAQMPTLTPAQLKSAGINGAGALSRAWKVKKQHRGVYTGGKWQVIPSLPPTLHEALSHEHGIGGDATQNQQPLDGLLFCLCDGDVSVVLVRTGELVATVQGRYNLSSHEGSDSGTITSASHTDAVAKIVAQNGTDEGEESAFVGESVHEEIVMFAVHPDGHEIVTVSRQLLLRHWVLEVRQQTGFPKDTELLDNGSEQPEIAQDSTGTFRPCWNNVRSWKSLHRTAITASEYDSSGTLVATAGSERVVKVWDVHRGYCTHNLKLNNIVKSPDTHRTVGGAGAVTAVRFHPDPHRLFLFACTEDDCAVRAWDLVTSSLVSTFTDHMSAPTCLAFSEDGYTLATAGRDKVVNFYDLRASPWRLRRTAPVYEAIEGIVNIPASSSVTDGSMTFQAKNSTYWATAGQGGSVQIWKFTAAVMTNASFKPRKDKKSKGSGNLSTPIDAKGSTSFTKVGSSAPTRISYSESTTSEPTKSSLVGITKWKTAGKSHLTMEEDNFTLVTASADHNFGFWQTKLSPHTKSQISGSKCDVPHFDISSTTRSSGDGKWSVNRTRQIVGYNDDIIDIKFIPPLFSDSSEGSRKAQHKVEATKIVAATNSADLRVVNLGTFDCELIAGHSDIVLAVDASPDGKWIASVSKDRTTRVWVLEPSGRYRLVATGVGHTAAVGAVSFGSKPHPYLAQNSGSMHPLLLSGSQDRTIKVWDMRNAIYEANIDEADNDNMRLQDVPPVSLKVRTSVHAHDKDINAIVVAPNDKLCASASQDKSIKLWTLDSLNRNTSNATLHLKATLKGHKRGVWAVAFSPVDRVLASSSGDGTVRVWSLGGDSGHDGFACIRSFEGHTASVLRVAFVNSGLQLISSGADGLLKLWALRGQNSACIATFERHRDKVWALAARSWVSDESLTSSTGTGAISESTVKTQLITGGGDSILNVWEDCTKEEDLADMKQRELMLLKEQELSNLVHCKKYGRAIKLALELDFPLKLRTILEELLLGEAPKAKVSLRGIDLATRESYARGTEGENVVRSVVESLGDAHLVQCLRYISIWNTNARHSLLAQWLLYLVVSTIGADQILEALKKHGTGNATGVGNTANTDSLIAGLLAYTERHEGRLDRLVEDSFLLDYTLDSMNVLIDIENKGGEEAVAAHNKQLLSSITNLDSSGSDADSSSESSVSEDGSSENGSSDEEDEPAEKPATRKRGRLSVGTRRSTRRKTSNTN